MPTDGLHAGKCPAPEGRRDQEPLAGLGVAPAQRARTGIAAAGAERCQCRERVRGAGDLLPLLLPPFLLDAAHRVPAQATQVSDTSKVPGDQQLNGNTPARPPCPPQPRPTTTSIATDRSSPVEVVAIGANSAGMRVDNFLVSYLKGVPKSLIYRILRRGEVRLNKARVKPAQRLTEGDQLRIPPLRRALPPAPLQPSAGLTARLAAAVLYEDERLLVLDKPAGLAVHGGSGVSLGLIEGLRALRPGSELELVHRLDRDTSGCLVISKRRSTLRWLHAQFRDGAIDKRYLLLLSGPLPQPALTVDAPLLKNLLRGGERMVSVDPAAGKSARTHFRRLRCLGDLTLAEARLETGRTHQIRVHAQHLGTPIAGDDKYGDAAFNARLRRVGLKRLFLHASALSFRPHAEADAVHIEAPLPAALAQVLARLEELPWTTS